MAVYPGDPDVSIRRITDFQRVEDLTVSVLTAVVHAGTHVDAPLHFFHDGAAVDRMPHDAMIGTARIIEIRDPQSIKATELEHQAIGAGEILLFKTRNSGLWRQRSFSPGYVYLSTAAAHFLAETRVKAVGIDYLSIGGFERNETEVHRTLLGASIWIIEGLDLSMVGAGTYEFICLPLLIEGAEAAPARVLVRRPAE
jgi:arylformamidase